MYDLYFYLGPKVIYPSDNVNEEAGISKSYRANTITAVKDG